MDCSDHDFDNGDGGRTSDGKCTVEMFRTDGTMFLCGGPWYSVMHPPEQFRDHWCSALENGWDCMCREGDEW
jgi:hypothetical protein